jgi:hypothetical protein
MTVVASQLTEKYERCGVKNESNDRNDLMGMHAPETKRCVELVRTNQIQKHHVSNSEHASENKIKNTMQLYLVFTANGVIVIAFHSLIRVL